MGRASAELKARTGVGPRAVGVGPGRVNIIGEHVDYAGGVVVPFAIDRWCVAAAGLSAPAAAGGVATWRVEAIDLDERWEALDGEWRVQRGTWQSYVVGALTLARQALAVRGVRLAPMSIAITSSVPRGSGLSSSAAMIVAVAKAVEGVAGAALTQSPLELARLCQRAENDFAGVPCGLMDHAASVLGREGCAISLSCREPETFEYVRVPEGLAWLVVESGVSRALAAGKYGALREASDEAARVLGVRWLWDADVSALARFKGSARAHAAAAHTLEERDRVARVLAACEARNGAGDAALVQRELISAHQSLSMILGVSCLELDVIVAAARKAGAGARLTGAGFGGCALVAADAERAEAVTRRIEDEFSERFGRVCPVWRVAPSGGAMVVAAG